MADMDPRTGKLDWVTIQCLCGYSVTGTVRPSWSAPALASPMDFSRSLRCSICGAKGRARVDGGQR